MIPIAKPMIGSEEMYAVAEVLRSGGLAQGSRVRSLEERFADYIGVSHVVAVSSGTAALHIAMLAHGIGKGDEVITTPFSFIATANVILFTGAKPVFADINNNYNINPEEILQAITPRTKAVLPVHLYGCPAEMKAIQEIADDHHLIIIEDACQAHGATYYNKKVGSFGTGTFSFYPTKNMTTGEGGMITTNDQKVAERARMLRNHGSSRRYVHEMLGFNLRMTDIGAAIGLVQLKKLDHFNVARRKNAKYLTGKLKDIEEISTPDSDHGHVFHQYTIRINDRDDFVSYLESNGIGTGIYYPIPIHKQPLYQKLRFGDSLPVSERFANVVVSLPVHPGVSEDNLDYIIRIIKEYTEVKL